MTKETRSSYLEKLLQLFAEGKFRPGVHEIEIQHNDTCSIWSGGACDCDPEIMLVVKDVRRESNHRDN